MANVLAFALLPPPSICPGPIFHSQLPSLPLARLVFRTLPIPEITLNPPPSLLWDLLPLKMLSLPTTTNPSPPLFSATFVSNEAAKRGGLAHPSGNGPVPGGGGPDALITNPLPLFFCASFFSIDAQFPVTM